MMKPETLWYWSTRLHRRGLTPLARVLKLANYVLFRAVLPYQCEIHPDIELLHHGLGVVVHENTRIGRGVCIGHESTLSGTDVGDGTFIGAGVKIATTKGHRIRIGEHCQIGLGAIVTRDVPSYTAVRVAQPEYRPLRAGAQTPENARRAA
jgi:serine O-acetyltransferase